MTAETSNARGSCYEGVCPDCNNLDCDCDAPPPAAARGGVRGLVAKLAAHVRPTCSELWAEAERLLNSTAPPSAPVGVELSALRVQEWLHREHDILCPVQEIEQAMRTPCSCPFTERALAQQPAAEDGDFINRIADSLIEKGWDIDPNCDGTGVAQLREAVISAIAQQPADVVVDDTRGRAK